MGFEPRPYQQEAINETFKYIEEGGKAGLCVSVTGCHRAGQKVIMYDGSLKKVEDVVVGDKLMGPDSTPRTVLQLCRGRQEMREIVPKRFGKPFVVNADHILSLYKVREGWLYERQAPSITNITVREYEEQDERFKHIHKVYHSGEITFPEKEPLFNPYLIGLLIGDGHMGSGQVGFTNMDKELLDYVRDQWIDMGDSIREYQQPNNRALTIFAVNMNMRRVLEKIGLYGCNSYSKRIPFEYMTGSVEERKQLLAGIIDTDGYISKNKPSNCEIVMCNEDLVEDIAFVARSLGYSVSMNYKSSTCQTGTFDAWRLYMYGDFDELPFIRKRHIALAGRRNQRKTVNCGFTVNHLPEEDYYGFTLDKDHLYLLDDFTVTHNTGKTVLVADTIKRFIQDNPRKKIIVLSHVKEIIEQDFKGLKFHWPSAPAGVYSASIGRRQFNLPIIFGSIQSCYRRPELFKNFDGILVDEAHLVSDKAETMYVRFINHLKESRPDLFLIGYTATPYRLGMGYLTSGPMFDDIFYDNSTMEKFTQLIDDGYLSNIVTMSTEEQFDVTGVKRIGGDFSEKELDAKLNLERITQSVVSETVKMAKGRKKGIAFCISVDHAINMARIFNEHEGYRAQFVHGAMANAERDEVMNKFRNGEINMLTNVGVATTGLDVPDIDYIVLARPTESTALYQQMVGRGLRIHPDKKDCLVIDFAMNTMRLGPINDPLVKLPGQKGFGDAPIRVCVTESLKGNATGCGCVNHASVRFCDNCKAEFLDPQIKVKAVAMTDTVIRRENVPIFETFNVDSIVAFPYQSKQGNPGIKMTFMCGTDVYDKYMTFDINSRGYQPSMKFISSMRTADGSDTPELNNNKSALDFINSNVLKPSRIKIWMNKPAGAGQKFKEIVNVEYG